MLSGWKCLSGLVHGEGRGLGCCFPLLPLLFRDLVSLLRLSRLPTRSSLAAALVLEDFFAPLLVLVGGFPVALVVAGRTLLLLQSVLLLLLAGALLTPPLGPRQPVRTTAALRPRRGSVDGLVPQPFRPRFCRLVTPKRLISARFRGSSDRRRSCVGVGCGVRWCAAFLAVPARPLGVLGTTLPALCARPSCGSGGALPARPVGCCRAGLGAMAGRRVA